jgi:hypothetical protein
MSIYILFDYMNYCRDNSIIGDKIGLKAWKRNHWKD